MQISDKAEFNDERQTRTIGGWNMGISQFDFERIVHSVAKERFWNVEINGTDVYLTYHTRKHIYRRYFDYNDGGKITGNCIIERGIYPYDVTPHIFANMVGSRVEKLLNE